MRMSIVPSYRDVFNTPIPKIDELLVDISSDIIIGLIVMIQAELRLSSDSYSSQAKILNLFLRRQSTVVRDEFLRRLYSFRTDDVTEDFSLFSMNYTLEFLHYALCHYKKFEIEDTTPEQEWKLLQAYFLFVEQQNSRDSTIFNENRDHPDDFFYKNTWPILVNQYEASNLVNPITEMTKGMVFFNFLQFESPYKKYVKLFLDKRGYQSAWHFVFAITNIIQHSWMPVDTNNEFSSRFSIASAKGFENLLEDLAVDPEVYSKEYTSSHRNFSGLKDKPLYKLDKESYLVLNWEFFSSKLYDGLIFDFYKRSGINEVRNLKTFPDFKRFISIEVTENFLFKRLLEKSLSKKHSVLLFDNKTVEGFPDAYYREGNKIILFEIKDAYFPSSAINTTAYTDIKNAIDEKYNSSKKGIGQLLNHIKKLTVTAFEFTNEQIRHRNLCIYPVMIYTDHFFSMPGINNYLQESFNKQVEEMGLQNNFKQIKPLVFINLDFIINHLDILQKKHTNFFSLMELFFNQRKRANKRVKRTDDLRAFFECYLPFEKVVAKKYGDDLFRRQGFVEEVINTLELTKGLPKD